MLNKNVKLVCATSKGVKYPCGECSQQATSKGNLNRHQRAVHDDVMYPREKSIPCNKIVKN